MFNFLPPFGLDLALNRRGVMPVLEKCAINALRLLKWRAVFICTNLSKNKRGIEALWHT
jgi:hypothetical protein